MSHEYILGIGINCWEFTYGIQVKIEGFIRAYYFKLKDLIKATNILWEEFNKNFSAFLWLQYPSRLIFTHLRQFIIFNLLIIFWSPNWEQSYLLSFSSIRRSFNNLINNWRWKRFFIWIRPKRLRYLFFRIFT